MTGNGNGQGRFNPLKIFLWLPGFFLSLWEEVDEETGETRYRDSQDLRRELEEDEEEDDDSTRRN